MELDSILIRARDARTPNAYDGLAADAPWRVSGVWAAPDGSRHVVELGFASLEDATSFAQRNLGLAGRWDDPDGDGNYCIVG